MTLDEFKKLEDAIKLIYPKADKVFLSAYHNTRYGFEADLDPVAKTGDYYVAVAPRQTVVWDYQADAVVDIHNHR